MDKKTLLIGGAVLVIGGAIATGAFLNNNTEQSSSDLRLDDGIGEKIEEQDFKDFEDEEKFSFCQGREEIKGVYTNLIFGNEKGNIEYISEDINLFDKEKNKLYILGRKIQYKYSGNANIQIEGGDGKVDTEEEGYLVEYYNRYSAPVRIDYNANIINPAPDRKRTDWVEIKIKSTGSLMGVTDEREDVATGDAKVFCSVFRLNDAVIFPDYFSFEKACPDHSLNPGVTFSGNFKYECGGIENKDAIKIVKEYKELEELRKSFDSISDEGTNEFEEIIGGEEPDDRDMQKKLEQMRDEMKSEGVEASNSAE